MAGSTMHWRDVYSLEAWDGICDLTRANAPELNHCGRDLRNCIRNSLQAYHAIPKTDLRRLDERRGALLAVYAMADLYLRRVQDEVEGGVVAKSPRKRGEHPHKGIMAGPTAILLEKHLDPWVHSLARTALKKRAYLTFLKGCNGGGGPFSSIGTFQQYVINEVAKRPPGRLLRLTPGTRIEQIDPLHRDFEHRAKADGTIEQPATAMSTALGEWLADRTQLPFFLWLEDHPICTLTRYIDRGHKKVHAVRYGLNSQVKQVWISNHQLVARGVFDTTQAPVALTTRNDQGTKKGEAYAWLRDGSLLIHPHIGGQFHHSSFAEGHKIRCAGMLKVNNGILQSIDNNSGHYHPSDRHYRTLIHKLHDGGVCDNATRFATHMIHKSDPRPQVVLRIVGMTNMTYGEYRDEAEKQGKKRYKVRGEVAGKLYYP